MIRSFFVFISLMHVCVSFLLTTVETLGRNNSDFCRIPRTHLPPIPLLALTAAPGGAARGLLCPASSAASAVAEAEAHADRERGSPR